MFLHVDLRVKFRAFGITFSQISESWNLPISLPPVLPEGLDKVLYNDRGVYLHVALKAATE